MGSDTGASVAELDIRVDDRNVPCVVLADGLPGRFELEEVLPRDDGGHREFYCIRGVDPGEVLGRADRLDGLEARFRSRRDDGGLLELLSAGPSPPMALANLGGLPRSVQVRDGVCRLLAEVPPRYDEAELLAEFFDRFDAELAHKREKPAFTPSFSERGLVRAVRDRLTDDQREAIETATRQGYYEWPRQATVADVADELGTDIETVSDRLRTAERELVAVLFEGGLDGGTAASPVSGD